MKSKKCYWGILAGNILLSLLGMYAAVGLGVINFSFTQTAKVIAYKIIPSSFAEDALPGLLELNMIWGLRIPRVLLGFIVGASLAVCGVCMQTLVKNKLADPYTLGVSSSSGAMACACMIFGISGWMGEFGMQIAAFLGALLGSIFVYFMSKVHGRTSITHMLLSGVILSMIMSAVISLLTVTAPDIYALRGLTFWLTGSLTGAKWEYLAVPALCMLACLVYLMLKYRALNAISFGYDTAKALGVNAANTEKSLFLVSSLLTGICVSVSGSIGFVGMIVPHMVRGIVGADHKRMLPICALLGGNLMVWADVAARLIVAPDEIPVGVMTSIIGVPVFLMILKSKKVKAY